MRVCVITDNEFIYDNIKLTINELRLDYEFDYFFSSINKQFCQKFVNDSEFKPINLKEVNHDFFNIYDLFISLHSKQLFPEYMVNNYRCINVHPGLNPYNRGWFPQVFSIINKLPVGVTIHLMDEKLDHGAVLFQEEVCIYSWDTSLDVYNRIQQTEIQLLKKHLVEIIEKQYTPINLNNEGNINYKKDFDELCILNLNQCGTLGSFIDLLRATTFAKYDNAYFIDDEGNKVYVSINLKKEK